MAQAEAAPDAALKRTFETTANDWLALGRLACIQEEQERRLAQGLHLEEG